jgi:hypothetical protein
MAKTPKDYTPPTEEEISCCAYVIYAREFPDHARELWRQAEAQLIADRKHDAGLFSISEGRTRTASGNALEARS